MSEVLYREVSVTLNASGAGTVPLGPSRRLETWDIERMITQGNSTAEPELNVYRGASIVAVPNDFTPFGNGDVSETTTRFTLRDGEILTFSYTGGTAGAVMRVRVEGTINWRNLAGGSYGSGGDFT